MIPVPEKEHHPIITGYVFMGVLTQQAPSVSWSLLLLLQTVLLACSEHQLTQS